jgi:hypothetical protein
MKQTFIQYKTKPEQVDENARLLEAVFRELQAKSPDDVRYLALSFGDGTFVHLVFTEGEENPIPTLAAFETYQSEISERLIGPPEFYDATIVGDYRMLSEAGNPASR